MNRLVAGGMGGPVGDGKGIDVVRVTGGAIELLVVRIMTVEKEDDTMGLELLNVDGGTMLVVVIGCVALELMTGGL
jgi:hypothetical protein